MLEAVLAPIVEGGRLYTTIEARWFYEGACPREVRSWFEAACGSVTPEQRIDRYLLLPDSDSLGAKLRGDDRIELKLRVGELPPMRRHGAHARRERWSKWSLRLADPRVDELLDHPWVAIDKTRWLRRFGAPSIGLRRPRRDPAAGQDGCGVELAALELDGTAWWSLAFESFGDESRLARTFDVVAGGLLGRRPFPHPLELAHSFGYPRWLQGIAIARSLDLNLDGVRPS